MTGTVTAIWHTSKCLKELQMIKRVSLEHLVLLFIIVINGRVYADAQINLLQLSLKVPLIYSASLFKNVPISEKHDNETLNNHFDVCCVVHMSCQSPLDFTLVYISGLSWWNKVFNIYFFNELIDVAFIFCEL